MLRFHSSIIQGTYDTYYKNKLLVCTYTSSCQLAFISVEGVNKKGVDAYTGMMKTTEYLQHSNIQCTQDITLLIYDHSYVDCSHSIILTIGIVKHGTSHSLVTSHVKFVMSNTMLGM